MAKPTQPEATGPEAEAAFEMLARLRQLEDEFDGIESSIARISEVCFDAGIDTTKVGGAWEDLAEVRTLTRRKRMQVMGEIRRLAREANQV